VITRTLLRCHYFGIAALLAFASCTFVVQPQPYPPIGSQKKVDLTLGLLIDDAQALQVHNQGCLFAVGVVHTWRIETGTALRIGAQNAFRALFTKVEVVKSQTEFKDKGLLLVVAPRVIHFAVDQSLTTQLYLQCRLTDRDGKVLYENTIPARGSSHSGAGCMMGVWGGETSLRENTEEAFNQAFALLASDMMKKVNFIPYSGH
jgi:hypothetical protein